MCSIDIFLKFIRVILLILISLVNIDLKNRDFYEEPTKEYEKENILN